MASPADIEDFATGFALSEGIVRKPRRDRERRGARDRGRDRGAALAGRRARRGAWRASPARCWGPVGCGLCGIDSLAQAMRPLPEVPDGADFDVAEIAGAGRTACAPISPMHDLTRAVHAAGFLQPGQGITHAREDVGRHNALDKLIGALARDGISATGGAFVMTSRVSVDIVQKAAMAGGGNHRLGLGAHRARAAAGRAGRPHAGRLRPAPGGSRFFCHPRRIMESESDVA